MEIRLSLTLLAMLVGIGWSLTATSPLPALEVDPTSGAELSRLEDAFAAAHDDVQVARQLVQQYLRFGQPALAIGVVRAASPELVADPILTHRLAQAYEDVGRLDDAAATAPGAGARAWRAIGSSEASPLSEPPRFSCSAAALVAFEQHEAGLLQMVRWGVTDPRHDPRARVARRVAERRAHIASVAEREPF
jgi:hypothetical protein